MLFEVEEYTILNTQNTQNQIHNLSQNQILTSIPTQNTTQNITQNQGQSQNQIDNSKSVDVASFLSLELHEYGEDVITVKEIVQNTSTHTLPSPTSLSDINDKNENKNNDENENKNDNENENNVNNIDNNLPQPPPLPLIKLTSLFALKEKPIQQQNLKNLKISSENSKISQENVISIWRPQGTGMLRVNRNIAAAAVILQREPCCQDSLH